MPDDRIATMPGMTRACIDVYLAASKAGDWTTIAGLAADTGHRATTVRAQVRRLAALGVVEAVGLWRGHRIRLAAEPNAEAVADLTSAAGIYGAARP